MYATVPNLARKTSVPELLSSLVAENLADTFPDKLRVFKYGSIDISSERATAAVIILSLFLEYTGRLNIAVSSTTGELAAIRLGLHYIISLRQPGLVVDITDSREVPLQLSHEERAGLFARRLVWLCSPSEDSERALSFHWVHSHSGVTGKESADALPTAAHTVGPTVVLDKYTDARRHILGREQRHHPHTDAAQGSP